MSKKGIPKQENAEQIRLNEDRKRLRNWKRWGPYLPERQWGTVREDYSPDGEAWDYLPFEHANKRAYRWGEDGLLGFCDRECRLCFGLGAWNGNDPIIKERLFGLNGSQGNHGEDCKELYYYLDSTPTHTYSKALYKYPQQAYPYESLISENAKRGLGDSEYEILDTGVFEKNRYFDIQVEYAKESPNDILIRITVANRGDEKAKLDLIPKLWFRNTWIWGCEHEGCTLKPSIRKIDESKLELRHESLDTFHFEADAGSEAPNLLFTENETNTESLYGSPTYTPYVKDGLNRWLVEGETSAVNPDNAGTIVGIHTRIELNAGESREFCYRLYARDEKPAESFGPAFDTTFAMRIEEANAFYESVHNADRAESASALRIHRQAYAGLLWTKQFYHYSVHDWLKGDSAIASASEKRLEGRNANWTHLFNRDVISMPDKWEYPWYAAWDLAFHMIPFANIDPDFAKSQLTLFLREWYMHPNGQLPAYEWNLGDVNPPTHAWACLEVYRMTARNGEEDIDFLKRIFHKLLLNFTWWVNRKDPNGKNIFSGGFLGLDNIGLFDRSKPLPGGRSLMQADGTAWMAFYCASMLSIALELAKHDRSYSDVASKFFEHFVGIADAINTLGDNGLWDEHDGFYYDQVTSSDKDSKPQKLKIRSLVGLIPLIAVDIIDSDTIDLLPGFKKRMDWYLNHRKDLAKHIAYMDCSESGKSYLLSLPSKERLSRILSYLFSEDEFLSDYGIRSLSKFHKDHPYEMDLDGESYKVAYTPGDSDSWLFGGNSNWRGPIWFPTNFLIIESLRRYHAFYGDGFKAEFPTGSGNWMNLGDCANAIAERLSRLFEPDTAGSRPCHGDNKEYAENPDFKDLVLFYEFFHGDSGKGLGASHQTGWTALVASLSGD